MAIVVKQEYVVRNLREIRPENLQAPYSFADSPAIANMVDSLTSAAEYIVGEAVDRYVKRGMRFKTMEELGEYIKSDYKTYDLYEAIGIDSETDLEAPLQDTLVNMLRDHPAVTNVEATGGMVALDIDPQYISSQLGHTAPAPEQPEKPRHPTI